MRFLSIFCLLLRICSAQSYDWTGDALPGVKINTVAYKGWIPASSAPLHGTLILIPGRHGDGRGMATDPRWQALGTATGFAIIGCQFANGEPFPYQSDIGGEVSRAINIAVQRLATDSQHPELANGPLAFWGTSAGSNVSANYCAKFPERVAAFASSKGTFGPGGNLSAATREIPMFFALGAGDKSEWTTPSRANIEAGTKLHAPWALAFHQKEGHEVGKSLDVAIPFLQAAIEQRLNPPAAASVSTAAQPVFKSQLPSFSKPAAAPASATQKIKLFKINPQNGWLGNLETMDIALAKDFKGSRASAFWLPDEATAHAWQQYLQSGK
ncbi:MAG: hypothetical protein ABIT76_09335 [Chthoniobacterales bacterium]